MKLETERLHLKPINESHIDDILKIRCNAVINRFVQRIPPKTNYDALDFIMTIKKRTEKRETVFFGIISKDHPRLIGTICLWKFSDDRKEAEIGYELLPEFHRKGLMSEALKAVVGYGFKELNLKEIFAFTHKSNENSKGLLLKNNFVVQEGRVDEGFPENIIFSLKKES
nr:GNAT family N-acetyltransferase [uncultured Chryseobacterium sp.]